MEYVLTEAGNIKITDGQPTVKDGDKEFGIDAIGAQARITTITTESNDRRKALGDLQTKHDALTVSNKGLQTTVDGIDDKNKVKVEEIKTEMNKAWEDKQTGWDKEKAGLNEKLFDATVGANFATSKVIKGTVLPPDIAKATFGKHFNPDGTANDSAGNPIYSKAKPGEPAGFDEAMGIILDNYPGKADIIKGSGANGSGGHRQGDGANTQQTASASENISAGLKAIGI